MLGLITILCLATVVLGNPLQSVSNANGRIIGGDDAKIEDHPYQLSLHIGGFFECGAIIISPLWALTAAQCAGGTVVNMRLRAGSAKRDDTVPSFFVVQKVVHLNYDSATGDFDIALLRVNSSFPIGPTISPVALPSVLYEGVEATVSGWGVTFPGGVQSNDLQEVKVPIVDEDVCKSKLVNFEITTRMICAGDLEFGGVDACQGDAGGPLVDTAEDPHLLVGIASWGRGCGLVDSPHVYTRASEFRNWILANSGV